DDDRGGLNEVIDGGSQKAIAYIGEHVVKLDSFGSFNDKFVVEHSFFEESTFRCGRVQSTSRSESLGVQSTDFSRVVLIETRNSTKGSYIEYQANRLHYPG